MSDLNSITAITKRLEDIEVNNPVLYPVPGYSGFFATKDGRAFSSKGKSLRELKPRPNTGGYLRFTFHHEGRSVGMTMHKLILITFVGPRPEGAIIRHLDGNKYNNCLENLAYGTTRENFDDMFKHGATLKGEKHHTVKLKEFQVLEILSLLKEGRSFKEIALRYGVARGNISHIKRGMTWKHIVQPTTPEAK